MARLEFELTFGSVCDLLRDKTDKSGTIDAFDKVAGALLLFSPVVGGPAALPAFGLIGAKNELVKLGKMALSQLSAEPTSTRLTRFELLSSAYCLTCYTAFFEAVDATMPDIYEGFGLTAADRLRLSEAARSQVADDTASSRGMDESSGQDLLDFPLELPHPTSSLKQDANRLRQLYSALSKGFARFIKGLAQWDDATESQRDRIEALIRDLPDAAAVRYRGQYLALCVEFNEFSVWANLREHDLTRECFDGLNQHFQEILKLRNESDLKIDLGLERMGAAIEGAIERIKDPGVSILRHLDVLYKAAIDEPIIRDDYESADGSSLRYPTKAKIFVPQAFRALRYAKGTGPLEDEKSWARTQVSENIGAFLLSHFSSPYSASTPLIVLGQPGSGKSLLTEIIAARLSTSRYTPIRVELRDINADSEVQMQLEDVLTRETGEHVNWVDVSNACGDAPPLIILDGYDELLQASGRVFSSYLKKVSAFQHRELQLNRPVRILVTSRITLIDKAEIPAAATVMRLEDFDAKRQNKWISTWNRYNRLYFMNQGLEPLSLPSQEKLLILAQQPLLLLMLALYDSEGNKLASQKSIDQTLLYDSLLRRFIDRERRKGKQGLEFGCLSAQERSAEVDSDMRRLGIAAIGMFNRRSLHILKSDLKNDISYFDEARAISGTGGPLLDQAELLLGSFFFVHESKSRIQSESADRENDPSAFEFLHNTFGEFLTADIILRVVMKETETVRQLHTSPNLEALLSRQLSDATLPEEWYSALMFTPLYTRPVVLAMISEWAGHRLTDLGRTPDEFGKDFDQIMYSQFSRLLNGVKYPNLISGDSPHPFPEAGVVDYVANFTLNLALIRTAVVGVMLFDTDRLPVNASSQSSIHSWDRMTYIWRAALGMGGLEGLGRMVKSHRDENQVAMSLQLGAAPETTHPLELIFETAAALGDDLLVGLTGWALQDTYPMAAPDLGGLLRLEAVRSSGLNVEMLRRLVQREKAGQGAGATFDDELNRTFAVSERTLDIGSMHRVRRGGHLAGFSDDVDNQLDMLLAAPAEFGPDLWHFQVLGNTEGMMPESVARNYERFQSLILTRVLTAAACIASGRDPKFGRLGRNRFRRLRSHSSISSGVAQVSLGMARRSPESLPSEVALEMLCYFPAGKVPLDVANLHLGRASNPWAVATRSRLTVQKLIRISSFYRQSGWIESALVEMTVEKGGPSYIQACGMSVALSILQASAKSGFLQKHDDKLHGVLPWILEKLLVEDSIESFRAVLSILKQMPRWADPDVSPQYLCYLFGIIDPSEILAGESMEEFQWLVQNIEPNETIAEG